MQASDRLMSLDLVVVQNTLRTESSSRAKEVYFLNTQKLGAKQP